MRKVIPSLSFCIIFLMIISPIKVTSNFGVFVGESFDYEVIKGDIALTLGSQTFSASGFALDNHHFSDGMIVSTNITTDTFEQGDLLEFTIGTDGYQELWRVSSNNLSDFDELPYFPGELVAAFNEDWESTATMFENGIGLFFAEHTFVETLPSTWEYFSTVTTDIQEDISASPIENLERNFDGEVIEDNETLTCEWSLTLSAQTTPAEIPFVGSVTSQIVFKYQKCNGVLDGFHMTGSATGEFAGKSTDLSLEIYYKRTDSEIPELSSDFSLPFPSNRLLIVFGALSFLGIGLVLKGKKKR